MKRYLLSILFSLLIILAPSSSLVYAADSDTLRLENYHGDAIDLSDTYPRKYRLVLAGDNVINTTGEYGLKVASSRFDIINDDEFGDYSTLTINVNSNTTTANGIINTIGSFNFGDNISLIININSALSQSEISTDNVTGITTPMDKAIESSVLAQIFINNPTGNFGIYTSHFGASQFNGSINLGYRPFLTITHKITDGYGDAFLYNDFEGSDISIENHISVLRPDYTFIHEKTATLGTFQFIPAVNGVSANFDTELTAGANFVMENARIVNSLAKELHPEDYTYLSCIMAPELCPFNPDLFEIDKPNSEIVLVDNLTTGAYHANSNTTISADESYALKITFKTRRPDFAFSKLDGFGPFSRALLNGRDVYDYIDARHTERVYVSPTEIYILAPLKVTKPHALIPEPTPEPEDPEPTPEPEPEPNVPVLPKAPNTGRK